MNERVLAVWEEDQGEVVLGCQDGGGVVEDAVGVASLQTGSTKYFFVSSVVSCSKNFYSAHGWIPY